MVLSQTDASLSRDESFEPKIVRVQSYEVRGHEWSAG